MDQMQDPVEAEDALEAEVFHADEQCECLRLELVRLYKLYKDMKQEYDDSVVLRNSLSESLRCKNNVERASKRIRVK